MLEGVPWGGLGSQPPTLTLPRKGGRGPEEGRRREKETALGANVRELGPHRPCTPGFTRRQPGFLGTSRPTRQCRGGLASLGAGDWLRSAPADWLRSAPADWLRSAPAIGSLGAGPGPRGGYSRTKERPSCTPGFARRREGAGLASLGAGGLASLGAGDWLRSAPRPRAGAPRRPGPARNPGIGRGGGPRESRNGTGGPLHYRMGPPGADHGGTAMTTERSRGAMPHVGAPLRRGAVGSLTDAQLLDRFADAGRRGVGAAFAAMVERHGPMVLRVCRRASATRTTAHDAFQATFLVLATGRSIRDASRSGAGSTASRAGSPASRGRPRPAGVPRAAGGRAEGAVDRRTRRSTTRAALHEEFGRLPERYRAAVVLCYLDGLTHEEAADRLGWPVGTVKSRLARGRAALRDRLARRGLAPTAVAPLLSPRPGPSPRPLVDDLARMASKIAAGCADGRGGPGLDVRPGARSATNDAQGCDAGRDRGRARRSESSRRDWRSPPRSPSSAGPRPTGPGRGRGDPDLPRGPVLYHEPERADLARSSPRTRDSGWSPASRR